MPQAGRTHTTRPVSVEDLARLAAKVAEVQLQADRAYILDTQDFRADERFTHITDELLALEEMASCQRADTLAGAMFQVMVSQNDLLVIEGNLNEEQNDMLDGRFRRIKRNMHSLLSVLEKVSGVNREEVGGQYYMPQANDPHDHLVPLAAKA
jgi:hypothetical protein